MSLESLQAVVARLPANIYRCKGVIHSIDSPARRTVLQVVGKRVELTAEGDWAGRRPQTRIVAIGAYGTLNGPALRAQFNGCTVSGP
jgi:G3E family GTPase